MKPLASFVCLLALANPAGAQESVCSKIEITINEAPITATERERLARELHTGIEKVCGWWGATFAGPLTVDVTETVATSMALIPAWRGKADYIVFPAAGVRSGRIPSVHELVHVFAPNANRFLAEGLAVYGHAELGGPPAFPNFGKNIGRAAASFASHADIVALERLAAPSMLHLPGKLERQPSYLAAGSFVAFLMRRNGLDTFRRLYATTPFVPGRRNAGEPGRWQEVYGASLDELAAAWRSQLPKPR